MTMNNEADPKQENEKTYPCKDCGTLRTKAEGGETFTVCDKCWQNNYYSESYRAKNDNLNFNELRDANSKRGIEWEGKPNTIKNLEFCTIEFGGESGELMDAVKKLLRLHRGMKNKNRTKEQCLQMIADECGDVVISLDRVAESVGINLGKATRDKFNKTSQENNFKTRL